MPTIPHTDPPLQDEGGLRPPPGLSYWQRVWWWFDFLILVKIARLRFVAILVVIGIIITQWDLLTAYYEKWMRPSGAPVAAAGGGDFEWFCPMHPTVVRPQQVKARFASASILKRGRVVFNIGGNKYRLVVAIDYARQVCFVKFIGTHEQYDAIDAETIT
jgi:mRNA interferase HigB